MKTIEELRIIAKEALQNDDDLFVSCVDELDSWNGYADGFRAYDMSELDDLHYGMKLSDFLDKLTGDFNIRDNYFYYSIYGLESCDDKAELYRDHVDELELLDNLVYRYYDLDLKQIDPEFDEIIQAIADEDSETAADIIARQAVTLENVA